LATPKFGGRIGRIVAKAGSDYGDAMMHATPSREFAVEPVPAWRIYLVPYCYLFNVDCHFVNINNPVRGACCGSVRLFDGNAQYFFTVFII